MSDLRNEVFLIAVFSFALIHYSANFESVYFQKVRIKNLCFNSMLLCLFQNFLKMSLMRSAINIKLLNLEKSLIKDHGQNS